MGDIRPYFRWWWIRYRSDKEVRAFNTSKCPAHAHGCYRLLLDAMWESGCELPSDREILWPLAGCKSRKQYEQVADLVEACFEKTEDGKFTSSLMKEEWNSATKLIEKKRVAGRSGGQARAKQMLKQTPSTCLSTGQAEGKPLALAVTETVSKDITPDNILAIAKSHPKLSHLRDESEIPYAVGTAIIEAVSKDGHSSVLRGTLGWAASIQGDDPKFATDPYKFFSQFLYRPFMDDNAGTAMKPSGNTLALRNRA